MKNTAIDELINTLAQIGASVHEMQFKIQAAESVMKTARPEMYALYDKAVEGYRDANQMRSAAIADGSAYGRLKSALKLDELP